MTLDVILAGIGAIVTAAGGIILIVRELRRRDRVASVRQIDDLTTDLNAVRQEALACEQWAFFASQMMVAQGMTPPKMPDPVRAPPPPEQPSWWQRRQDRKIHRQNERTRDRAAERANVE